MRLLSVQVAHWRGLEDVTIGPLSPHLNLITGSNRSGKTRLQQAIWFAMMESSKGNAAHKSALQSRRIQESPRVTVEFESDGTEYELTKQFLKNSFTRLAGGGRTLEGLEAETQLRAILGTKPGGRMVDIADSGIWPLLWVEQGKAGQVPHESMNEDARNALHGRLGREVGAATIGKVGTEVMAAAETEYQRHFTAAGQERIELRAARTAVQDAQRSVGEAIARHEAVASLAEEVQQLRQSVASYTPRVEAQNRALQEALLRARAAEQSKSALAVAEAQRQRLDAERVQAAEVVKRRADLVEQVGRAEAEHGRAEEKCKTCAAEVDALAPEYSEIEAHVLTAESLREKASTARIQVTAAAHKAALKREISSKADLLEAIQGVATKSDAHSQLKASLAEFTDKAIRELRQQHEQASRMAAEIKGAAVGLTITAKKPVVISGKSWSTGESQTLSIVNPTTILIGDVAELEVQPGGSDLTELRDRARDVARELKDRLAELGVETLADAEQRNSNLRDASQALKQLQERLGEMAPQGVEALKTALTALKGEYEAIDVPDNLPTEAQAKEDASSADRHCETLRAERDALQKRLSQARVDQATADQALLAIAETIAALRVQLSLQLDLEEAEQKAAAAHLRWEESVATRNAAQRTYEESGGEAAQLEHTRAARALENLERDQRKAEQQLHTKSGELQRAESEGLYERRQNAEASLAHASAVLERKLREAEASKALWEALAAKRAAMQERLIAPIVTRVSTYLEPLFGVDPDWWTPQRKVRRCLWRSGQSGTRRSSSGRWWGWPGQGVARHPWPRSSGLRPGRLRCGSSRRRGMLGMAMEV